MNRTIKIIFGCIFAFAISGCAEPKKNITHGNEYYPKLNSMKKEIITVYGNVPRDLIIDFKTVWVAGNKEYDCRYDTKYNRKFVTITKGFYISKPINIKRDNGKYKVKFYLDKYIPGYCNWQFSHLEYIAMHGKKRSKNKTVVYKNNPKKIKSMLVTFCDPTDNLNKLKCGNRKISPNGTIRVPLVEIYEKLIPGYKKKDARVDVWCTENDKIFKNTLYCSHWNEKLRSKRTQHNGYGVSSDISEVRVDFHIR